MDRYRDRIQAGEILADSLKEYQNRKDVVVLGLPRGGVPVGFEIAKALRASLDVWVVRKLGVPGHEELAMGAIGMNGVCIFNDNIINSFGISPQAVQHVIETETREIKRREQAYRGNRPLPSLSDKVIILVDDGIATGATIRAGIKALRQFHPQKIVIGVPVADEEICEEMKTLTEEFVCPRCVPDLQAVGLWYENFPQTEDDEVHACLNAARSWG